MGALALTGGSLRGASNGIARVFCEMCRLDTDIWTMSVEICARGQKARPSESPANIDGRNLILRLRAPEDK
jgi:hypothetical protein